MKLSIVKSHLSLCLALLILWGANLYLLITSLILNDGHLVYVLDDPYIHMALAKQFVTHGVWGVTQYGFTSSSSSVLWPLLLSFFYWIFGPNTILPLILNIVLSSAVVWIAYLFFYRHNAPPLLSLGILLLIIFVAPLPTLVFVGLEHLLHIFCVLLFLYFALPVLMLPARSPQHQFFSREMNLLLCSAVLMCLARYEGLFTALAVCVLFAIRRKFLHAITLGLVAITPLALYGIISMSSGSYLLPNSLILKSSAFNIGSPGELLVTIFVTSFRELLLSGPSLILVLLSLFLIGALYYQSRKIWTPSTLMLSIYIVTTLLQLGLASAGFYYYLRYDAYLLVLGIVVVTCALMKLIDQAEHQYIVLRPPVRYALMALLALILLTPPFFRRGAVFSATPQATNNVYQQQFQIANFLSEYYSGRSVAANDIGLISYQNDIKLLDLWGLASIQVTQAKRAGIYNTDMIARLAREHHVEIAVVYESWYGLYGGLPKTWEKVGTWTVSDNLVLGDSTVTFYAVDKSEAQALRDNMNAFATQLPIGVQATVTLASEGSLAP